MVQPVALRGSADADGARAAASTGGDVRRAWTRIDTIAAAIIVVASVVTIALFTHAYPTFSPVDELQHVDYAIKAGRFELVPDGDRLGDTAMREFVCNGVDAEGYPLPPCSTRDLDPELFPDRGYNTAALHLPVYYTVTGVIGRVIESATPFGVVTSLRLTGALWLSLALVLTWLIGAELGVRRLHRALAIALVAPAVQLVFTSSTVNADNALMAAGALIVLAVLRAEHGRASWWWVVPACIAALAMEPTSSLAVASVCVYLLVRALLHADRDVRRSLALRSLGLAALCGGGILFVDLLRDALIGGSPPPNLQRYGQLFTSDLGRREVAENLMSLVTPISEPYVPPFLAGNLTDNLNALVSVALVVLLVVAFLTYRSTSTVGALGASVLAVMITAGPLLVLYLFVHSSVYFEIPSRYGLALMPAAIAVAAAALTHRPARVAAGGLAAVHGLHLAVLLLVAL